MRFEIKAITKLILMLTVLLFPILAQAQVLNGDFNAGGADWASYADSGFATSFPVTGGIPDGFAKLESGFQNQGGRACITQTFICSTPDGGSECTIGFDYFLTPVDAAPGTGRITVVIDGIVSVVVDHGTQGWEFISYVVPCGQHTIEICLEVDPVNNSWVGGIDNVRAECTGTVANEDHSWDYLKSMYR